MKMGLTQAVGGDAGIDYRLMREMTLSAWRNGKVSVSELCDAQPELRRNAEFCGRPLESPCPVCETDGLVEVTYVFGPRLPGHGRCVTSDKEMTRLNARKQPSVGYVVEVCTDCGWNHLTKSRSVGGCGVAAVEGVE
ncbi:MAG: hypothetical protein F4098_04530, partial [Acidimicrobiaceae bacterium]|nr:hypothetical protein [Acidimicrobiaceae bacterium]